MTNGEAITELHMLQCRFHQIRKSDAAWEAIEMAKDALLAREKSKDDLAKHGKWEVIKVGAGNPYSPFEEMYIDIFRCSLCRECIDTDEEYNYCPNCGAKMDGGAEK